MAKIIHDLTDISEVIAKRAAGKAVKFDIQAEINNRAAELSALEPPAFDLRHDVPPGRAMETQTKFRRGTGNPATGGNRVTQ